MINKAMIGQSVSNNTLYYSLLNQFISKILPQPELFFAKNISEASVVELAKILFPES